MLEILCTEHMAAVKDAAEKMGRAAVESLEERLEYLDTYANGKGGRYEKEGTKCVIGKDFAPLSFSFSMFHGDGLGGWVFWFHGGLIYHGPDVPGDGSAPSYTVDISGDSAPHWSIHT